MDDYEAELARISKQTGVPLATPPRAEPSQPQQPQYTAEEFHALASDNQPPTWQLVATSLCAVAVMCALLVWLKRNRGFRLFGGNALERLGGLLFWPPLFLLLVGGTVAFQTRYPTDFFVDVARATFPENHGEPLLVFVVNAGLLGALLRFILLPFLSWLRTGRWRRS